MLCATHKSSESNQKNKNTNHSNESNKPRENDNSNKSTIKKPIIDYPEDQNTG